MTTRMRAHTILILIICILCNGRITACELMGFSVNKDIAAHHLFSAFRSRGNANPDGWGVAFYSDKSVTLFKEAENAAESELAEFLGSYRQLRSKLLVAHVRRASVGGKTHQNTHPFVREIKGKEYVLAHNGTLRGFRKKLELGRIRPLGINDSEFLLCYLLGRIEKKGVAEWNRQSFEWLREEMHIVNDTGSLNCLFSDGTYLFAYYDKNGYNDLYYLSRKAPYGKVHFTDSLKEIDLSVIYQKSATGVIVATRPLTDERWKKFTRGQLLIFKDGVKVFPEEVISKRNKPNKPDAGDGK